jgi:TolB-like protein/DNA-binding winged helix-turn-helix (wHTH) protein/Flp pilus assembly protein TadD
MIPEPIKLQEPIRFGEDFEFDVFTRRLRRGSRALKVERIPLEILVLLVERPGEIVTRNEIVAKVWGKGAFLDTDNSIRGAIRKIRQVLKDDPEQPRFIQTVTGQGYRFVAPLISRSAEGNRDVLTDIEKKEEKPETVHARSDLRSRFASPPIRSFRASSFGPRTLIAGAAVAVVAALTMGWYRYTHRTVEQAPIRAIAVLPLENLTADPEQDYLANGITETLITDLGRVSALRVISRTSVKQYKGARKPLSEIGRELNVDAVVEGALLRSGDRIRITVHLVRLPMERQLWSQAYEGDLRELSALQGDVTGGILSQLREQPAAQEESLLARQRRTASNPEAYRLYLQGRYLASKPGVPSCKKSLAYFEQAIQADPSYALPYAGMADSYGLLSNAGALDPDEGYSKMKSAALKALELNDQLGEAHESLGYYYMAYEWNWAMAEAEFRRAIKLSPNFADAHGAYAEYLQFMGRTKEAAAEIRNAYELDPLDPWFAHELAWNYLYQRDYDHGIEQFRRNLDLEPNLAGDHRGLGYAYMQKGRFDDAIAEIKRAQALQEDGNPNALALLAYAYGMAGSLAEAQHIREQLQRSPRPPASAYQLLLHIGLGETDRAFAVLEKAVARHELLWSFVAADPRNDPLRSDPHFADLLRRVNLPY